MFDGLTNNFSKIFDKLRNRGAITEHDLNESIREIRRILLEADVALPVIKDLIQKLKEKAIGQGVIKSISPGQMIIKIINDELINLLQSSEEESQINLKTSPPANILLSGLQGSGKTTSAVKLAKHLNKKQNKKVLLVSLDIYRPAAKEQLSTNAAKISIDSLPPIKDETIDQILDRAESEAKLGGYDVVIYDSAGRLHIDSNLIDELSYIKKRITPSESLLVLDSMTGQDAVNIAKEFNNNINVTGIILTRVDGDSRGGAALSVKFITGAPIKFLGTGEKLDAFEEFNAERITSRILGKGDVVSLVEKAMEISEQDEMEKFAKRMQSGKFDLNDYSKQIKNIQKLGGVSSIIGMLPGIGKLTDKLSNNNISDKPINRQLAIISSMTKKERKNPDLLNASRKKRIASGSGANVSEINKLLKQFTQIAKMLKKTKNMDKKSLMRQMPNMLN